MNESWHVREESGQQGSARKSETKVIKPQKEETSDKLHKL